MKESSIDDSENIYLEKQQQPPSVSHREIRKHCIGIMQLHSAVTQNEMMSPAGKWSTGGHAT